MVSRMSVPAEMTFAAMAGSKKGRGFPTMAMSASVKPAI